MFRSYNSIDDIPPYIQKILKRTAQKAEKVFDFVFVAADISQKINESSPASGKNSTLIINQRELPLFANALEKYYLFENSISALVIFIPTGMASNIHVGQGLSHIFDSNEISMKVADKYFEYIKLRERNGSDPLTLEEMRDFYFTKVREFVTTFGRSNDPYTLN